VSIAEPEVAADAEIDQPVVLTKILAFIDSNDTGARDEGGVHRRTTLRGGSITELANDVHRRERLPVEAYSAFAAPIWFKSWITDAAAVGMKRSAVDPPGPGVFRSRGKRRRLGECRLGEISGAGARRGGGECYNGNAREESDPEAVAAVVHFIHPLNEPKKPWAPWRGTFCSDPVTSNSPTPSTALRSRGCTSRRKKKASKSGRTLRRGSFARAGRGQWKDVLTPQQVQRIVDAHGEQMQRFGYLP
jgi:hypothetical protein